MRNMKKVVALVLSLVMMLSLAACSGSTDGTTTDASNTGTTGASNTDMSDSSDGSSADTSEGTKAATGGTGTAANNINACIASEPETIDPNLQETSDAANYAQHMFEGLMKYVSTGETVGGDKELSDTEISYGQAESYEVSKNAEGQTVYTFTLRDDIYWSDGEPVVAGDFEYSWKRIVDPENAAAYGYILDGIVVNAREIQAGEVDPSELGIVALDDKTLEITLEADSPYFIELCAYATLMPLRQDVIEEYGTAWTDPGNMVSNGAFVLSEWVHDSYMKMVPNEYYYDAENITPGSITWWLSDNETAMISSYESGNYDFLLEKGIPVDRIDDLQASGDLYITPYIGTYFIYINTDIVSDWRVRAALTLAIDTEYMVESVTQGGQTPATGLVPGGITNSDGDDWVETYGDVISTALGELYPDYDLTDYSDRCELAQTLYQEAVDEGTWDPDTTLAYLFNTSDTHQTIAEAIQSDWKSVLGVNCTLSNQDWNVYTTGLAAGEFGVARMGWIADYDDPVTYLELYTNGNNYNYGDWESDEYTALIAEAKSLPDGAERDEILAQAEAMLFGEDGFPIAPVYFYTTYYCRTTGLKNVEYSSMGYFFFHHATME